MSFWWFVQNQILGMQWLNSLVGKILTSFGIDVTSRLGGSLHFFIYDILKILLLLWMLIFIVSYVQSYFPPERSKRILAKYKGWKGNLVGALLGTITPFCSCSSIPIFIGFTKAGVPLGVTFSFLISSPFVDLAALILLSSVFGIELAMLYVLLGIILAIVGGKIIEGRFTENHLMEHARPSSLDINVRCSCSSTVISSNSDRVRYSMGQVKSTYSKVWVYILIGVVVGALIHNWVPEHIIQTILGDGNPFSVVLATVVGIPIYADIFGTIPIAEALYAKGAGVGTILAFMMGVTATSIPSLAMLKGVCKTRLLIAFFLIILFGILVIGYTFNIIQLIFCL